jgi:hypothetical protein
MVTLDGMDLGRFCGRKWRDNIMAYGTINIHNSRERRNCYPNFKLPKFNPTV